MKCNLLMALLLPMIGVSAVVAMPVQYDENPQGDIPRETLTTLFNFDLGANTIIGDSKLGPGFGADFDNFSFTIPESMYLSSVTVGYSLIESANEAVGVHIGDFLALWDYDGTNGTFIASSQAFNVLLPSSTQTVFNGFLPLQQGQYLLTHNLFSGVIGSRRNHPGLSAFWDYELTFNVTAVPETSPLLLLITGLFVISFFNQTYNRKSILKLN